MVVAGRAVPFMWGKKGGTAGVVALVPFGTRAFLFSPLSRGALRRRLEAHGYEQEVRRVVGFKSLGAG
jgi:hypothetical protein